MSSPEKATTHTSSPYWDCCEGETRGVMEVAGGGGSPRHPVPQLHALCLATVFLPRESRDILNKDHRAQLFSRHRHPQNPTLCLGVLSKLSVNSQ